MLSANINSIQHHARRAITTLQSVAVFKSRLHGVHRSIGLREALDGRDLGTLRLREQHITGLDGVSVHQNCAGTTLRCITADMGTRQVKVLTKRLNQQGIRGSGQVSACSFTVNWICIIARSPQVTK